MYWTPPEFWLEQELKDVEDEIRQWPKGLQDSLDSLMKEDREDAASYR